MGRYGNSKTGKRSAAPLLISIFWLVSVISATFGAGYMAGRDNSLAASDVGTPARNEARFAREADNQSTPVQRPMRVAALETLHLKIKSGLRSDTGPQDALLPSAVRLVTFREHTGIAVPIGSRLILGYNPSFSARAPPLAA